MSALVANEKISEISSRIERLPLTSWQMKALATISALTFFDAFDAMTIAFALPVLIGPWGIKPQYIGLLISAGFLGQMLGAIGFGRVAERIGRLHTIIIAALVFSILSFFLRGVMELCLTLHI
jgi:putative MFS transporter